jgi:uncharacterized protein (TIGR02118 family)
MASECYDRNRFAVIEMTRWQAPASIPATTPEPRVKRSLGCSAKNGQVRQQSDTGGDVWMIKVSAFLRRRPDLTPEQFSEYWTDKHAPLVMRLGSFTSSVRRYSQQHSLNNVPAGFPILPYDGVAELWFDNLPSALAMFAHQDYVSIIAKDEENFLDRAKTVIFLSSETLIV